MKLLRQYTIALLLVFLFVSPALSTETSQTESAIERADPSKLRTYREVCPAQSRSSSDFRIVIDLVPGWNLISWNVETDSNIEDVIADIEADVDVVLGFESGGLTFDPDLPQFSTLSDVDHYHGYWFNMQDNASLTVPGYPVDPTTPIGLEMGWNLASYLPANCDSLPHALASIYGALIVVIGFWNGGQVWLPGDPSMNTLTTMCPGFGYWIKVSEGISLTYPDTTLPVSHIESQQATSLSRNAHAPTPEWISVYCSQPQLDGVPLNVGDTISFYDPDGVLCGEASVASDGSYGFACVYRDDWFSPDQDEGADPGDLILFRVNGVDVRTIPDVCWTSNGDRFEVCEFHGHSCGDADGSGAVDIDDVVYLIQYIFAGGPAPVPLASGDADCAGGIDIDDVVYLINYIFAGGPAPCDPDGDGVPDC